MTKTRPHRCADCGTDTPNIYNLCDPCREASTTATRRAQGLPDFLEDRSVAAKVAALVFRRR